MRIGYACMNVALGTKTRTCRLANATPERVAALARENLKDAVAAGRWNTEHGIGIFRLTSGMVPFGSNTASGDWREALQEDFRAAGRALAEADQRLSTHPGQFTVLNSPRPDVVTAALEELRYQADMLEALGVDGDMVIHLGGAYGDRPAALRRLVDAIGRLPEPVARRLVLENDDVTWNVAEAVQVSEETGIPVVFDNLHDAILPSPGIAPREALAMALSTWPRGRKPKIHYSDQADGKAEGAHADHVDAGAFTRFLEDARGLREFDVMVEAKGKERAVLPLLLARAGGGHEVSGAPA